MRLDTMKRMISFMLAMVLLFSGVPVNAFATETESAQEPETTSSVTTGFEGKTVSILGDSISTYTGVSNNTSYNSTIGSNAVYYTAGRYDIYRADTWWQQVIDALGMELLVNNSWSGSMVVYPRQGEGSEGYKTRCVNLHNNEGREPDVILVFMGTNDFSYVNTDAFLGLYTLGTADAVDYETLIVDNGDGTYTYATPATTCEAYAIMLHKMKNRYPNAEIYCMNLMQRRDPDYADSYADAGQPTGFNAELAKIIAKYECALVDLENCGIEADSSVFDLYIGDKRVHPNSLGMDLMSEAVISAMLGQDTDIYDVSFDLTNVTGDGAHAVLPGNPYTVTLTEAEGFKNMSVTVTMGGEDVTASCYAGGVVSIPAVTGDVLITAESMDRAPLNFLWEFDGTNLATITSNGNAENALTKLAGSVTDGMFSSTRYQMDRTVMLLHDRPWTMEWKGTGKGGFMLAADSVATTGDPFFFRRQASQMFAFGIYEGSQYNNYGITLPDTIDTTLEHIYRLENRIAEDGSNMVYLYVDDVEIGALNQYFVAGTAQGTISEWISGQDFLFNYIGTQSHPLTDMSVAYLRIEEDSSVHHHSYTAVVTPPTYTEGGYTTYTCTGCGDSYIADYTDAIALYSYRWEMVENGLESVTRDGNSANPLTLNAGSVTDGTFAGARYTLENSVRLYHDAPWVMEWKASGDWSAMLLTSTAQSATQDMTFLFRTYNTTGLLALGTYSGGSYYNYGIALTDYGLDMTLEHTYRLENRIAEDGSNMVYLIVDGTELGAMNNYYIGGTNNQNQTVDWVNGRDFTFGFMGSTSHPLKDMALAYLQIWEGGEPESLTGKTISILGDSISTYDGISNNAEYNSTIGGGAVYYPRSGFEVTAESTWWYQAAQELGLEILVNNSWSGSCLLNTRSGTVGAYIDRCVQLHDDTGTNAGQAPDIIAIFLGTNDYYTYPTTLGSYEEIPFDTLITEAEDGYSYAAPATSMEAYAIILHKIGQRYPDAEVYCFTLLPRVGSSSQPTAFNEDICQLAQYFGVNTVDLHDCGILSESTAFYMHMGDSLHPDTAGMNAITNAFVSVLLKNSGLDTHDVSFSLEDTVAMEGTTRTVVAGDPFTATLAPLDASLPLEIAVTMGGADITESCCAGNTVTIPAVTGEVVITAKPGQREPMNFRWETKDDAFVSVTTDGNAENNLTMTHGSITDGVFSKTRFTMSQGISLRHDLPWCVEWKSSGTWTDTTDGALLFAEANSSATADACYFYRRHNNDFFAFGSYTGGKYHNYGVKFAGTGIDTTAEHVFRLENRIASDGSNMIYLLVDGAEVGPMNHHYVGGTDQKETVDWVSGKDFTFSYMGTTPHTIGGCSLEYVQVWEGGRPADYAGKVISIMGDSISTFDGYIPVADGHNREHLARYPQDNLLTDVKETWWMQVISALDAKLGINESWRGSTLSGAVPVTTGDTGENAAMSNLIRIQNMGSNGTPDVILLYGGTNDLAHVSKVGTFDPATAPTEVDLTTTKWDNLADGFVHTLLRMRHFYPDAMIVALLPTYTASYYSDEKLAQGNAVMAQICEHYGIPYVDLRDSGVTADHLPDGIHPGEKGMDLITDAVLGLLLEKRVLEPGENVVWPVSHELTHVKASLGHYKGVSAGKPFEEILDGENMTVSVTMGGVDITGECYADGKITIPEVTGTLVVKAEGSYSLKDHLQQLPDPYCGVNLWQVLAHDPEYYSADGWTTHSSGQVKSITFPVSPGDRLYASSFEAAGTNGGSMDGIRVTYFAEDGLLLSMTAAQVYSEFARNGCLTVPEGAAAVSIPMWTDSEEWDVHFLCILDGHLQQIPEGSYNDTNLWPLMAHDPEYYSADGWATHSSGGVKSVTFPVSPGDRLYASSFGAAGTNGSTTNGIRVTYFTQCGVLVSLTAAQVYTEFSENGYLTIPEGVYAVSIPMWTDTSDWELYVLTLPDRPVVTVEISWGAMEFTYTDGAWNPDTHTYAEGTWTADADSNYITVANEGTLEAAVTFVYENASGYAFTGTFADGDTVIDGAVELPPNATRTVWLTLAGQPEEYLNYVTIGTVTVIIE